MFAYEFNVKFIIGTELQPSSNIPVSAQSSSTDNHKLKALSKMYAVFLWGIYFI